MNNTSQFVKKLEINKKCMRILSCANYIFLDEIGNFKFNKISNYNKSKNLYNKVTQDFKLVNELINQKDLLNAATILRTLYENIIYIIAKSYDRKLNVTLNTMPQDLRKVLEENCEDIFTEHIEKEIFNEIYKYLCKIVHPCSVKELISYISKNINYKNYLLSNLKYITLVIEYIYLNFLNKKAGNKESNFDLDFINLTTYINIINISYFIKELKDDKNNYKRYFYYDTNDKYIKNNQKNLKKIYEILIREEKPIENNMNELANILDIQIGKSKYNESIKEILSGKELQ